MNTKLSALQADVNSLPNGGSLEVLRASLVDIMDKRGSFADHIDTINGIKNPENAPLKDGISNDFNGFEHDHGGCLAETPYPQN